MSAIGSQPPIIDEVEYPSGDGEPMAETPIHVAAIILLLEALQDFFAGRTDVYLSANSFWYWEKGNPSARRAPDIMVVCGVTQRYRRSFMSWLENGAIPCTIFEVCSEKTWRENLYDKRRQYAELGVKEYFLFDPEGAYLRPVLMGYRLDGNKYVPLEADTEERLTSNELGVFLRAEGEMLRLIDAATGQPILTRPERIAQQEQLATQEKQRADALAAEVTRLRAQLGLPPHDSSRQPE